MLPRPNQAPQPVLSRCGAGAALAECVIALREQLDDRFTAPARRDRPDLGPLGPTSFEAGLTTSSTADPSGARVLVVDDDLPTQVGILADADYGVRDLGSAREARHPLHTDAIDLLLSEHLVTLRTHVLSQALG